MIRQFILFNTFVTLIFVSGCSVQPENIINSLEQNKTLEPIAIEITPLEPLKPMPPAQVHAILLPQEDGKVGKLLVADDGQETMLDQAWQGVETKNLDDKQIFSEDIIRAKYRELLDNMPKKPNSYTLYYQYDSIDITKDSNDTLAEILNDIKSHPTFRINIIGHTDRGGKNIYNDTLSMKRANQVAQFLTDNEIDEQLIVLDYYGEEQPIIPTEDGVKNEFNRRVEITVK